MNNDWFTKRYRFKRVSEPLNQLEQFCKDAFEQQFENAQVELIRILEPLYYEDPNYIEIHFVYSSTGKLDVKTGMAFIRLMRSKLPEIGEERFPAISKIEYNDYLENTPKELLT